MIVCPFDHLTICTFFTTKKGMLWTTYPLRLVQCPRSYWTTPYHNWSYIITTYSYALYNMTVIKNLLLDSSKLIINLSLFIQWDYLSYQMQWLHLVTQIVWFGFTLFLKNMKNMNDILLYTPMYKNLSIELRYGVEITLAIV